MIEYNDIQMIMILIMLNIKKIYMMTMTIKWNGQGHEVKPLI